MASSGLPALGGPALRGNLEVAMSLAALLHVC